MLIFSVSNPVQAISTTGEFTPLCFNLLTHFLTDIQNTYLFLLISRHKRVQHSQQTENQAPICSRHELMQILPHKLDTIVHEKFEKFLQNRPVIIVVNIARLLVQPALNKRVQFNVARFNVPWLHIYFIKCWLRFRAVLMFWIVWNFVF